VADAPDGVLNLTINGHQVQTPPGRMLIDVAEENDVFVPRFCYHPGLESVAACRMCLVQIEGGKRPLEPACATQVADGMVVHTDSPIAVDAQKAVLELLLINHPLDCPICDRGGECPLQDQTLQFGPGATRYVDEKRHFPKPIPISELVMLDRERCVLCWRCARFSEEIAGDPFIDLMDRGSLTQINVAKDKPFDSYFSGNTIQICPVGALTSRSYRFLSRPWDLDAKATTCSYCSVGCPISIEHRSNEVLRAQALPNDNVNQFWICDKGRFGHRYVSHPERLKAPLVLEYSGEGGGKVFVEPTWDQALGRIADRLKETLEARGPSAAGFIGGSHATNEDQFAASRFFREVVGTNNLDFRTFDAGYPYELLSRNGITGSTAAFDDLDSAKAILWFGPDPKEELPVAYLRLRRAAGKGARIVVVHSRRTSLSSLGVDLRVPPGREAELLDALSKDSGSVEGIDPLLIAEARSALSQGQVVVCAGPQFVGRSSDASIASLAALIGKLDAKLLLLVPNANSQGALDMGLSPHLAAGHAPAGSPGMDARWMLQAAVAGDLEFLWIMGADLLTDFPDFKLADAALRSDCFVVVSELFPTETARSADIVLPALAFAEKEGTFTNLERRIQKVNPAVTPLGIARADWQIFSDLAHRMGADWGWHSSADIAVAIAGLPTHQGFSWEHLNQPPAPVRKQVVMTAAQTAAWPLSWELREVDAKRRSGWIWGVAPEAAPSGQVDRAGPEADAGRPHAPRHFVPSAQSGVATEAAPSEQVGRAGPEADAGRPHAPHHFVPSAQAYPGAVESFGPSQSLEATPAAASSFLRSESGAASSAGGFGGGFPLLLLSSRLIYDEGAMVSRSPELHSVTLEAFVELHPEDAAARGLVDGEKVTISSPRGSLQVVLRILADAPRGCAFVPFDQPGGGANVLMDAAQGQDFVEVGQ
jgi:NADH-quinone oxidoreductase subunit G